MGVQVAVQTQSSADFRPCSPRHYSPLLPSVLMQQHWPSAQLCSSTKEPLPCLERQNVPMLARQLLRVPSVQPELAMPQLILLAAVQFRSCAQLSSSTKEPLPYLERQNVPMPARKFLRLSNVQPQPARLPRAARILLAAVLCRPPQQLPVIPPMVLPTMLSLPALLVQLS